MAPSGPFRRVMPFVVLAFFLYLGSCLLVFLVQARLVYFPSRALGPDPSSLGIAFEEPELVASDGVRLHGWFLPAPEPRGALLFCHGNAGNVSHRLVAARAFRNMGLSVLLFDYRGYGRSDGRPSEEGTYLDAEAAYDWLRGRGLAPERIALYGESLGGGVAIELARRREVACVLVESAFTSVPDLGAELYRWLPVRLLARIRYDNAEKLGKLRVPLLLVHSPDDEIVPFAHAERLLALAREPKDLLRTEAGHNDGGFLRRAEWLERVREFLVSALRGGGGINRPSAR
jgi:fermentation-respiration switch protein FrsA (DUF1100 family)